MSTNNQTSDLGSWPFWPWSTWMSSLGWPSSAIAPQNLNQPILPGWMIGNSIVVNETNSSSPETEQKIVANESYGRQLGRVIDALAVLIEERRPGSPQPTALNDLIALRDKVNDIKAEVEATRGQRIEAQLASLKTRSPDEYRRILSLLKTDLAEAS
jgi:hypothetical protein